MVVWSDEVGMIRGSCTSVVVGTACGRYSVHDGGTGNQYIVDTVRMMGIWNRWGQIQWYGWEPGTHI